MSCTGNNDCTCGCCAGTGVQTPQPRNNAPGLDAVSYRVGTWSSFNESMLARLSSADYPALSRLKTRDTDDFSIALVDASAVVLDVLSFYQERLANEAYLRTAQQLRSLTELSRLIGYQPSPGVSASTYVAFTLKAAPGQLPDPTTASTTIPQGTQIQSVPAQGQMPQMFETAADIQAKSDWNALPVQSSVPWIAPGTANSLYLAGTLTKLQQGDSLLLLGINREAWTPPVQPAAQPAPSPDWRVVVLNQVLTDNIRNLTYVSWDAPLPPAISAAAPAAAQNAAVQPHAERARSAFSPRAGGMQSLQLQNFASQSARIGLIEDQVIRNPYGQITYVGNQYRGPAPPRPLIGMAPVPASAFPTSQWTSAKVFAFRQKAPLFGHNAPNANLFVNQATLQDGSTPKPSIVNSIDVSTATNWQWLGIQLDPEAIDLDAAYAKVVAGTWFALTEGGRAQLYKAASVQTVSRANFAMSAKVTRLSVDYLGDPLLETDSNAFTLPLAEVWLQSEQLAVPPQPLNFPLYGAMLDLQYLRPDLIGLQAVVVTGKRQKVALANLVSGISFLPDDGTAAVSVNPGDTFTLMDPAPLLTGGPFPDWSQSEDTFVLSVQDANGRTGAVQAALKQLVLVPSNSNDPYVGEYALVSFVGGTPAPYPHTQIQLQSALDNCYERATTSVNANVALVTHGQSVSEIVGSGNASTPNQNFTLRQSPLTYVQAATPSGRKSALQVEVNGMDWTEVPSLYGSTPSQQVFDTLNQSDGTADIAFGDGEEGALLPTGRNNILANYRIGLGAAGNVPANTLTTLIDRPLGVSGVSNPQTATGGQDAQSAADIRANAPLSVLTLGRAVSLSDYENFSASFAGIAKAHALWIPSGPSRGVFLTVAGVGGAALPAANPTLNNLVAALRNFGNPLIPVTAQSFVETLFGFSAELRYDPAFQQDSVRAQVVQALLTAFSFAQRDFGQGISVDEIATVIQNITGVVAVNVHSLNIIASSLGGDLAGYSSGFSLANWRSWISQPIVLPRPAAPLAGSIAAFVPTASSQYLPLPAEILVIDPDPSSIALGVMS
ncbi:MAG TPA: putative baseplate assembly protein [Steroidobacteraceae bacterium]|jgi:hypothetical protein|nr:putative baseplate assembly protein [Steroidobacteraceae bacterium]